MRHPEYIAGLKAAREIVGREYQYFVERCHRAASKSGRGDYEMFGDELTAAMELKEDIIRAISEAENQESE